MIKKVFNSIYLLNDYKLALNVQKNNVYLFDDLICYDY